MPFHSFRGNEAHSSAPACGKRHDHMIRRFLGGAVITTTSEGRIRKFFSQIPNGKRSNLIGF